MRGLGKYLGVVCAALALPAFAALEHGDGARGELRMEFPGYRPALERLDTRGDSRAARAALGFVSRYGGEWSFLVDAKTGKIGLAQGSGIPLIPGRGNRLGAAPGFEASVESIEPLVRAFVEANQALIGPGRGRLELNRRTSLGRDDGRLWSFYYDWLVDDRPSRQMEISYITTSVNRSWRNSKKRKFIPPPSSGEKT